MVYCENCFKEELDYYLNYNDSVLCCEKCIKEWKEIIKINRYSNQKMKGGLKKNEI